MSTFPNSPRLLKGGMSCSIPRQARCCGSSRCNTTPTRSRARCRCRAREARRGPAEALRLKGPPVETIKLEAEIDATDQLEFPDQNRERRRSSASSRSSRRSRRSSIRRAAQLAGRTTRWRSAGTLEIVADAGAAHAVRLEQEPRVPVRITEFSITEEAFDPSLNPIRAKVSLGLRVLSVNDLGFEPQGGSLFMSLPAAEGAARRAQRRRGSSRTLGIGGIP